MGKGEQKKDTVARQHQWSRECGEGGSRQVVKISFPQIPHGAGSMWNVPKSFCPIPTCLPFLKFNLRVTSHQCLCEDKRRHLPPIIKHHPQGKTNSCTWLYFHFANCIKIDPKFSSLQRGMRETAIKYLLLAPFQPRHLVNLYLSKVARY